MFSVAIDVNADVGESFGRWTMGNDEQLLALVSSASVACGFHAGDPSVMAQVCQRAAERGTAIGAHVSYPDLRGFGRRPMALPPDEVRHDVIYQTGALMAVANAVGTPVRYVKPHGALYNTAQHDAAHAEAVVEGVLAVSPDLALMTMDGGKLAHCAEAAGIRVVSEFFVDRAYNDDGSLVSRDKENAVITDSEEIAARVIQLATTGSITTISGGTLVIKAESLCIHGDAPEALHHATRVSNALNAANVVVRPACG